MKSLLILLGLYWASVPPAEGQKVVLTDLPNPINNPHVKSCYIGSEGTVKKVYEDGSFDLSLSSGATLIVNQCYLFETISI